MANGLTQIAFQAQQTEIEAAISDNMKADYALKHEDKAPAGVALVVIKNTSSIIAGFTLEELKSAQNTLEPNAKTTDVSHAIAKGVRQRLEAAIESNDPKYAMLKLAVNSVDKESGEAGTYFNAVEKQLQAALNENLKAYEKEFVAMLPQPPAAPAPVAVAETKPEPAPQSAVPVQVTREEPATVVPAPNPPAKEEPKVVVAAPPPVEPETPVAETKPDPAPVAAGAAVVAAAAAPAKEPPSTLKRIGEIAGQLNPFSVSAAQAADDVPPTSLPPPKATPAPVAETTPPPAPAATPVMKLPGSLPELSSMIATLPPGTFGAMLPMLQNMFNAQEATRDPASPAGQFRKTQLEPMIREAVKKAVGDSAAFEKDIPAMAAVLQKAGGDWLTEHAQTLQNGNLSREQIHDLSRDLATGVRSRMTKERVGRFADTGPLGMIDVAEMVTGVDKEGKVTHPYEMNIFGMGETALASQTASEEAKTRYQQELAYAESNRRWREGEGRFGLGADAAGRTAASIAAGNGYGEETQAKVGNLAREEFRPGWWDWLMSLLENFLNAIIGNIAGLFGFKAEEGHKFIELNDWEKTSAQKNVTLFRKILREPDPANLGYTGDPAGFEAWKQKLATDVTGIHLSREGYLIDHNGGQVRGLTAALLGLSPDGRGTAPGTEGVMGLVPDSAQRESAPASPLQPISAPAAPTEEKWVMPGKGAQDISYQPNSDEVVRPSVPGATAARAR